MTEKAASQHMFWHVFTILPTESQTAFFCQSMYEEAYIIQVYKHTCTCQGNAYMYKFMSIIKCIF